jgi:hypothetical protein
MSTMFKRLFDTYGKEIFKSEDIIRGMEYYVSTRENFISPLRAIRCKLVQHALGRLERNKKFILVLIIFFSTSSEIRI